MSTLVCWNCGASLADIPRPIRRSANCLACYAELHCCRLCRHYDETLHSRCDDERADPPSNREGANFCDFFVPGAAAYDRSRTPTGGAARNRLDALFADDSDVDADADPDADAADSTNGVDEARSRLDALFGSDPDEPPDSQQP